MSARSCSLPNPLAACKDSAREVRAADDDVCPPHGEAGCDTTIIASPLLVVHHSSLRAATLQGGSAPPLTACVHLMTQEAQRGCGFQNVYECLALVVAPSLTAAGTSQGGSVLLLMASVHLMGRAAQRRSVLGPGCSPSGCWTPLAGSCCPPGLGYLMWQVREGSEKMGGSMQGQGLLAQWQLRDTFGRGCSPLLLEPCMWQVTEGSERWGRKHVRERPACSVAAGHLWPGAVVCRFWVAECGR